MSLRIIVANEADTATLSASPAVAASLPVTNLQDPSRARVMRTTGLADQQVKATWTVARQVSALALVRHNLTGSGTLRVQLYSDAAWSIQVYDSGALKAWPVAALGDLAWGVDPLAPTVFTGWGRAFSVLWLPSLVTARSLVLTLSDPTNGAGYMEASRLFVGRHMEPDKSFDWGIEMGWREDTRQERTDGGTLRSDATEPYRRMRLKLSWLSESDRPKWVDILRAAGRRKDLFVSAEQSGGMLERDYTLAAKIVSAPVSARVALGRYEMDFEFEEA